MPKSFPAEFRRDVVAVARLNENSLAQVAKDFGISEATVYNWLRKANLEDGLRPGTTKLENLELREANERIRLLEQENETWGGQQRTSLNTPAQNDLPSGP